MTEMASEGNGPVCQNTAIFIQTEPMHSFTFIPGKTPYFPPWPLVFFPGWAFTAEILHLAPEFTEHPLSWIIPQGIIDPFTLPADLHIFLKENSIPCADLAGWSMGAYTALDFADKYPEQTGRILLMSVRNQWPDADIDRIRAELSTQPAECLRVFYRRCFLGNKPVQKKFSNTLESPYLTSIDHQKLMRGLDYLASPRTFKGSNKETVLFQGRRDIITPIQDMADIPDARHTILNQAGHDLFLSKEFWQTVNPRHKNAIRRRFSLAADTYDQHSAIQKTTVGLLQNRMQDLQSVSSILEIGCGTGVHTGFLAARWPEATLFAVDFSSGMTAKAKKRVPPSPHIHFLCADGEQVLADAERSFSLITSSACMQWFEDHDAAFKNMARLLSPGGSIFCSLFGSHTLNELSRGIETVLHHPVSLPAASFPDLAHVKTCLQSHFVQSDCREILLTRRYESFPDLLLQLRKTGTSGIQAPHRFTSSRIRSLDQWFNENYGGYILTYQLILINASNPRVGRTPDSIK